MSNLVKLVFVNDVSFKDVNKSLASGTMILSFSVSISSSTILANNLANSDSYHSPVAFGYQPSASRSILSPSLNLVGILNPSASSNLDTTVIFKIFEVAIISLTSALFNESNTFEILIPPSIEILASSIKLTNNKISLEYKILVLFPSSSIEYASSRTIISSLDVILSLIVLEIISDEYTTSNLTWPSSFSSLRVFNNASVSGSIILSFSSALIPNSTILFNNLANSQSSQELLNE